MLENLTKVYPGGTKALDHLNIEIESGSFTSLLGPSGCGKTTTLKLIAGLLEPTEGKIFFDDEDVTYLPPQKRGVGLVFQDYAVFPHMTGFENIAFGLKIRGVDEEEIKRRINEIASLLEIEHVLSKKPKEMNISELQRVSLARTIVIRPRVLLLDEPLSNLDATLRVKARMELKKLQKHLKQTIIYVTHDQIEALTLSDKVAVMSQGKLMQYDSPENIFNKPRNKFVAGFVGTPPMNFIDCTLVRRGDHLLLDAGSFQLDVSPIKNAFENIKSNELILGIRPRDVIIQRETINKDAITGEILTVEPQGVENVVAIKIGEIIIKAIAPTALTIKDSQKICFKFDLHKIHIFDRKSGEAYL
jgi:multiple sugar transport system ATP-binding protein